MTTNEAKKIVAAELQKRNLPYTKLTAKTVDFSDLARATCIFVKIHGWQPNPAWDEIRQVAVAHGFRIQ